MYTQRFPKLLLAFILVILAFQIIATVFYWYWRIPWFDILMHFLGGMWVGMSALWFYLFWGKIKPSAIQGAFRIFMVVTMAVLSVALLWEVFEYGVFVAIPHREVYDIADTLGDILAGVLGGALATLLFLRKKTAVS